MRYLQILPSIPPQEIVVDIVALLLAVPSSIQIPHPAVTTTCKSISRLTLLTNCSSKVPSKLLSTRSLFNELYSQLPSHNEINLGFQFQNRSTARIFRQEEIPVISFWRNELIYSPLELWLINYQHFYGNNFTRSLAGCCFRRFFF